MLAEARGFETSSLTAQLASYCGIDTTDGVIVWSNLRSMSWFAKLSLNWNAAAIVMR